MPHIGLTRFRGAYRREERRGSPLCEKPKVYAEMPAVPQEGKERL